MANEAGQPDLTTKEGSDELGMGFLEVNLSDIPKLVTVEEGEHRVRCTSVLGKKSTTVRTSGQSMLLLRFVPAEEQYGKEFTHVIMLPYAGIDERDKINRLNALKEACDALGVDYSGGQVNFRDFIGAEGYAILSVEQTDRYGEQNRVQEWVTGP